MEHPKELMDQLGGRKTVVDKMWAKRSTGEKAAIFSESWSIARPLPGYLNPGE